MSLSLPPLPTAMLDVLIARSVAYIETQAPGRRPSVAVILGSGWQGMAQHLQDAISIPYKELPAFPALGVGGHAGELVLGYVGQCEVALLSGRKHAYETGDCAAMKGAIRTLKQMGCEALILTNAAGSLAPTMQPGELMLITDHLNLTQLSPLFYESGDQRFVDLRDAYAPELRAAAMRAAKQANIALHEGVYAWMMGPQFETPAEIRMLQTLGATAVGMSTVPETILARHVGLQVLGLSMITNMGCGLAAETLAHEHTLATAQLTSDRALRLLESVITHLKV